MERKGKRFDMKKKWIRLLPLLLAITLFLGSCELNMDALFGYGGYGEDTVPASSGTGSVSLADIPAYQGDPYVAINNNTPYFTESEITATWTAWAGAAWPWPA
jgi:DNA-entry nuclease